MLPSSIMWSFFVFGRSLGGFYLWGLVLSIIFVGVDLRPDTKVYNAKALSPNGKYGKRSSCWSFTFSDLNIQVIQVKLLNWTPEHDFQSPPRTTPAPQPEDKREPAPKISKQRPLKIRVSDDSQQPSQYSANSGPADHNYDAMESFVFLLLACSLGIVLVLSMTYMILTVRSYRKKPKLSRSFSVIYHHRPMDEFYYHQTTHPPPPYNDNKRPPYLPPLTGPPPELPPRLNRPSGKLPSY